MPVSSPHVQSHGKYVCAMMCAYDVLVGRGAWAFGFAADTSSAWCACGEPVYRVQLSVSMSVTCTSDLRYSIQRIRMRQLPISYSSDGERLLRRSRARAGCVCAGRGRRLCLLELSLRRWRARVRALAMSSSHGNGMAARRASRSCTAVVAACRACGAADEACVMKMVCKLQKSHTRWRTRAPRHDRSRA